MPAFLTIANDGPTGSSCINASKSFAHSINKCNSSPKKIFKKKKKGVVEKLVLHCLCLFERYDFRNVQ